MIAADAKPYAQHHRRWRNMRIALLLGFLWLTLAFVAHQSWIRGVNHRDFYPRWAGARLVLLEDRDPYSDETTRAMQRLLYGRELNADEDPQAFAYPVLIVPLLLPFWLIPDVEIATAVWEATSLLLLIAALIAVRRALPPPTFPHWWLAVPLAALAFAYAGLQHGRDGLAGAALVAGFIKPELVALPAALLLVLALKDRRWRFIGAFMLTGGVMFSASLLIAGWWVIDWQAGGFGAL